jgi:hypothetical protein
MARGPEGRLANSLLPMSWSMFPQVTVLSQTHGVRL